VIVVVMELMLQTIVTECDTTLRHFSFVKLNLK